MRGLVVVSLFIYLCSCEPALVEYCGGRLICTNETREERFCLLLDGILDLKRFPVTPEGLERSHPASLERDAISARCVENLPPNPLLSNAFGMMSETGRFGDFDVGLTGLDDACTTVGGVQSNDLAECLALSSTAEKIQCALAEAATIRLFLNRDMGSNVFHVLYNQMFPLFRLVRAFNVSLQDSRVQPVIFDTMPVQTFERQIFTAWTGGDKRRLKHWYWRPFPCKKVCRLCEPALLLGGNRHWRTWLHAESEKVAVEVKAFASTLRSAFALPSWEELAGKSFNIVLVKRTATRAFEKLSAVEKALKSAFPQATVKSQRFERLSFGQQLEVVGEADVLIAVHGAALALLPFMAPTSLVIEVLPLGLPQEAALLYSQLAAAASVRHVASSAPRALQSEQTLQKQAAMEASVTVNSSHLIELIRDNFQTQE